MYSTHITRKPLLVSFYIIRFTYNIHARVRVSDLTHGPLPLTPNTLILGDFADVWHVFIYLRREFPFHLQPPPRDKTHTDDCRIELE